MTTLKRHLTPLIGALGIGAAVFFFVAQPAPASASAALAGNCIYRPGGCPKWLGYDCGEKCTSLEQVCCDGAVE